MASIAEVISSYHRFAESAEPLLHISDETHYEAALSLIEKLLEEAEDKAHEPLNGLIELVSSAIDNYENKQHDKADFTPATSSSNADVAMLRLLMDQHKLGMKDFPEIGDKSLISRILRGERNLTKQHITMLASRFNISPALFF